MTPPRGRPEPPDGSPVGPVVGPAGPDEPGGEPGGAAAPEPGPEGGADAAADGARRRVEVGDTERPAADDEPDAASGTVEPEPGGHPYGVQLPRFAAGPLLRVLSRLAAAAIALVLAVLIVFVTRHGYEDSAGGSLGFSDVLYYVTVSLSTTGYGDIVPVSQEARLTTTFLITPLRLLFLIILVGTTLEVLAERTREQWRVARWRRELQDHTVVVGFGTKGRSAAETLRNTGLEQDRIVVVDTKGAVVERATADGYASVRGDATRSDVLRRAHAERARQIVIATERDDTAVLVTLTARQLSGTVRIVASVRELENVPLLRQSGADSVITSASAVGQLLGLSVVSPSSSAVMGDLIHQGSGMSLGERPVAEDEVGRAPRNCKDMVVSIARGDRLLPFDHPDAARLADGDRLIVIHHATRAEERRHVHAASAPRRRLPPWPRPRRGRRR